MEEGSGKEYAPYAPVANILTLLHRQRERGLPDVLGHQELVKLGLPEESTPRIRKALQFLNLTDTENRQLPNFERLGRAVDTEYPEILKDILEDAYSEVFQMIGDISSAQSRDYYNAFKFCNPRGQQPSMIRLFMALCQEAGMLPEGAVTRVSGPKTTQKTQLPRPAVKPKGDQPLTDTNAVRSANRVVTDEPPPANDRNASDGTGKYQLMQVLLKQLPVGGTWTQKRHDQWLRAVETSVDLLVEIAEPEDENQNRPQQPELPL